MELNLSREDAAALLPLFDLSSVMSDDWTTMTNNIGVHFHSDIHLACTDQQHRRPDPPGHPSRLH